MTKVKTLEDLKKLRESLQSTIALRESSTNPDKVVQVKVSMATCGIASGAKTSMNRFIEMLNQKGVAAIVTQTGCMGYCHSEPTIEVILPDNDPVVFGNVKNGRIDEIVEKYIVKGELVDGVIPHSFKTIE